ncbi:mitochondrial outer membrane protein SLC25A46-like [Watersipora subatra]|uniref:mitochondrial outer membrane protein SLC25A46-like n=1 Tax=Watersipora subatra TaxID=2589382 RepID=UPI00355C37EF
MVLVGLWQNSANRMSDRTPNWSPSRSAASFNSPVSPPRHRQSNRPTKLLSDLGVSYDEDFIQGEHVTAERFHEGNDEKYLAVFGDLSFSLISLLTQRVLAHPCMVFRNQCQLNTRVHIGYKLTPWSIFRPMHSIYKNQGIFAMWKGIQNDFLLGGIQKSIEMVVAENSSLPMSIEETERGDTINTYSKHLMLKTISCIITTPLLCASYTLCVQSQVVVSDANYLGVFSEAYHRLVSSIFATNSETSHLLPLYTLVTPIVVVSLGSYVIQSMANAAVQRQYQQNTLHLQDTNHDEIPLVKTLYDRYYPRLLAAFSGQLLSDIFLYPLATITGRLILQGTRTIIDDADTGNAVLPFTSNYSGVVDCFKSIMREEGFFGLYKGFGALILQFTAQAMILRGTHLLYERIMDDRYPRVPRRTLYTPTASPSTYSSVTSLNTKP